MIWLLCFYTLQYSCFHSSSSSSFFLSIPIVHVHYYIYMYVPLLINGCSVSTRMPGFQGQNHISSFKRRGSLCCIGQPQGCLPIVVSVDGTLQNSTLHNLHVFSCNFVTACWGIYLVHWFLNLSLWHRANFLNSGVTLSSVAVYSWLSYLGE